MISDVNMILFIRPKWDHSIADLQLIEFMDGRVGPKVGDAHPRKRKLLSLLQRTTAAWIVSKFSDCVYLNPDNGRPKASSYNMTENPSALPWVVHANHIFLMRSNTQTSKDQNSETRVNPAACSPPSGKALWNNPWALLALLRSELPLAAINANTYWQFLEPPKNYISLPAFSFFNSIPFTFSWKS